MAANSNRGEVSFEVGGKEYIFKFGINAQAIIEDRVSMSIGKFLSKIEEGFGAKDIRLIFYASLSEHHDLTEIEVGDLIDEIGGEKASKIFMEAAKIAQSRNKKANGSAGGDRPTKPTKEPIGTNS